ncbi:WG repeat-containing protein [Clostridiales bacterium]|nr:WG repeat-containing protein [Clostridiales bacterium]
MKRFVLVFLALCLCCSAAAAEISVTGKTVEVSGISMNEYADTFAVRTSSGYYQVVDPEMNPLSKEYPDITATGSLYVTRGEDNKEGLLDGKGQELIAPVYDDIQVINDDWYMGITLKEATADNYDYESWFSSDKKYYLIDTADLYFHENKLATLSRADWYYATAYGDYIIIQDREKKRTAYNKAFEKSEYVPEYSSEYEEDYRSNRITHVGSGQEAFVPGCTLTPEEVRQRIWVNNETMLVDLQGNVLADLSDYLFYNSIDQETNLIKVKNNKKKTGLLDSAGNVLVPCAYDDLEYNLDSAYRMGYVYAVKDGKSGFVNLKTQKETGFDFIESACKQRSAFIIVNDPREGTILVSAVAGELPERYKDVNIPYSSASLFATVQDMDGRIHVIDAEGKDALADNPEIRSLYDVTYSKDGSLILVQDLQGVNHIYTVTVTEEEPEEPEPEATAQPAEEPDGTWTCENGHSGNTGKFCSECGAAKPQ